MNENETKAYILKLNDIRDFYKTYVWKKFRNAEMKKKKYRCEKCWKKGYYHRATVLHHKKHLRDYPELALTESNMEALCEQCHIEEHPEEFKTENAIKFKERWD